VEARRAMVRAFLQHCSRARSRPRIGRVPRRGLCLLPELLPPEGLGRSAMRSSSRPSACTSGRHIWKRRGFFRARPVRRECLVRTPWYLGGEKVPICTQVRFLPSASPALQRAFASRGRADRPRPRKAHLLEPGCHLAMFEAVTTSQWKAKTRICRSIFASSMLAATLSIA
jgi:hypothetical protein